MQRDVRVFWIGDSTVQYNGIDTWPQCGMGQELGLYLRQGVAVENHARNGRSTKSFRDEGLWAPVEQALGPGDILLIQFGHNDEKTEDSARYSSPEQYAENLLAYAKQARQKGALPVLITPLTRRRFENGLLTYSHGAYPAACRTLAANTGLPLIDLTTDSRALVAGLGEESSRELYMYFEPGRYANYPAGMTDNTHLRYEGAVAFCGIIAQGLRTLGGEYAAVLL